MLRPLFWPGSRRPSSVLSIVQYLPTRLRPIEAHALCEEAWPHQSQPPLPLPLQHSSSARSAIRDRGEGGVPLRHRLPTGFQRPLPPLSIIFTPSGARQQGSNFESYLGSHHHRGRRYDRPKSLARTQTQVQSSTADLPGLGVPLALILLVPQSLVFLWGRAKGLVRASSHLSRLSSDPCPLVEPLEVYGAASVLAQLWGRPSPNFSTPPRV